VKKVLFFILTMALFSCKKESEPLITGDWDVTFITTQKSGSNTHTGVMSLVQNGEQLTGTFNSDGSEKPLLSTSNVNDIVTIYCDNLLFAGSINSDNNQMSGDLYSYDYFDALYSKYGTWQATKR
jgi:hypothetical protein